MTLAIKCNVKSKLKILTTWFLETSKDKASCLWKHWKTGNRVQTRARFKIWLKEKKSCGKNFAPCSKNVILYRETLTVLAIIPIGSGYWCVSNARRAVNEHKPAVNKMKKGSSFFGYTDTSWKTEKQYILCMYEQYHPFFFEKAIPFEKQN